MNNGRAKKKAGRPRLPKDGKKVRVVVFLPPDLIAWMDEQQESKAVLIERRCDKNISGILKKERLNSQLSAGRP